MQSALSIQQGFSDNTQTIAVVETASSAIAAQSKAMVESRYIMAMRNPRNWDQVRADLIKECHRPSFANNKSAYYVKPIGAGVEGLGIRFVEVALRCMKNVLVETTMIFEDGTKEVHRVSVTDLEANITYPIDVRVSKTVERSKPMDDGSYLSVRKNSYNKPVYTVVANDDDLLNKRGALISKAIRTIGLRIIPGDLCDEAEVIIKKTRLNQAAADPDGERKKIIDAFAGIGVSATNLAGYFGHGLEQCSPTQIVELRGIYGAIKDGEATWKTVMENKVDNDGGIPNEQLELVIKSIGEASSKEQLDKILPEIDKLIAKDKKIASKSWTDRLKICSKSKQESEPEKDTNWINAIKECGDSKTLTDLMEEMPESVQLELQSQIDEKYDSFR